MIGKLTIGTILTVMLAIGVVGITNNDNVSNEVKATNTNLLSNEDVTSNMAFADKFHKGIISIPVDDFGATSGFDVEDITCKVVQKERYGDTVTKVKWCKANATLDREEIMNLEDLVAGLENFDEFVEALIENPTNADQMIIEFEFNLLTNKIQEELDKINPPVTLPDDFKKKSITMDMITNNKKGVENTQTKLLMMIKY